MNSPYHNKGFGVAFLWIMFLFLILPLVAMMTIDDTWSRFLKKYGDPIKTECWENSKHEKVCRSENSCKFLRNFRLPEIYRSTVENENTSNGITRSR